MSLYPRSELLAERVVNSSLRLTRSRKRRTSSAHISTTSQPKPERTCAAIESLAESLDKRSSTELRVFRPHIDVESKGNAAGHYRPHDNRSRLGRLSRLLNDVVRAQ